MKTSKVYLSMNLYVLVYESDLKIAKGVIASLNWLELSVYCSYAITISNKFDHIRKVLPYLDLIYNDNGLVYTYDYLLKIERNSFF